jgi:acetylornithine deacetylase
MTARAPLAERAIALLQRLVAFDTTSALSNLELIAWIEDYLAGHGVASRRVASADGKKANLLATVGPSIPGGVVLSGHTDVVPVKGQPWTSDPFVLTRRDGKLFGRGTCDMKGFIALALAAVPDMLAASPSRPAHLAFSYDEEIGCLGAPALIEVIARELPAPALVMVGEPTSLRVVGAHKGINVYEVVIRGREAHSSQTHLGASAIQSAARLMGALTELADQLERDADPASPFEPKHSTLTIGEVSGGTAGNILARDCRFQFDFRADVSVDPDIALAGFFGRAAQEDAAIKLKAPEGGVTVRRLAKVPALQADEGTAAEALVRRLSGYNGPVGVVSFAAEAGQFHNAGLPSWLCGPGSIDQAHQPDEFIEITQMERGAAMMQRLVDALSS